MKKYSQILFSGQMNFEQIERFFSCTRSAVNWIIRFTTHDQSRDYFKPEEFVKLFVHLKFSQEDSENIVSTFFAFKKLLVGGHIDRLRDEELSQIYQLMPEYEKSLIVVHRHIKNFRSAFLPEERQAISEKEINKSLHHLQVAFQYLKEALMKHKVVYQLEDVSSLHMYLHQAGLIEESSLQSWSRFSKILNEWAQGIFGENPSVQAGRWETFFLSLHDLISQYVYYQLYVADKNISEPNVFSKLLKSFNFFLSSISRARGNQLHAGFPVKNLDKILQLLFEEVRESENFSSEDASEYLDFLNHPSRNPIPLLNRALFCFAFPSQTPCNVSWSEQSDKPTVEFQFPDGKFLVYSDRQAWQPDPSRNFLISPGQLTQFKNWVSYWSRQQTLLQGDFLFLHQDKGKVLKAWFNHAFNQDRQGQISFGGVYYEGDFSKELARSFTLYDSLIRLFLHAYSSSSLPAGSFTIQNLQISSESWVKVVDELSPVIMSFHSDGYSRDLRSKFLSLLDYGDNLLNTSNYNGSLEYSELIDISLHLSSALVNSKRIYESLQASCLAKNYSKTCFSHEIFSTEKRMLDNFPYLQGYISGTDPGRYSKKALDILPEEIKSSYDLMGLFMILQSIEVQFLLLDKDLSFTLSFDEAQPVLQASASKVLDAVDFLETQNQALAFLSYSAHTGSIPFFKEDPSLFLQPVEFYNWTLDQDKRRDLDLSRFDIFSLSIDLYNLSTL